MIITYKRNLDDSNIKDVQHLVGILIENGLTIIDKTNMKFTENFNFSTNTGKNRSKIFYPLLKGELRLIPEKNLITWRLHIESIFFKALILTIANILIWKFLLIDNSIISLTIGITLGIILFGINIINLSNRVDRLTEKMIE
ncbi:hypothetical protein ACE01N_19895 [Saccharicrinis sp. FJH2]|uniref:hypothetical protein n=1 Tax=Saccharicrinis sp. FJH65 TaxID=3344659 RepID=UPI0035F2B7CE